MQVPLNIFVGILIITILLSISSIVYQIKFHNAQKELKLYHSLNKSSNLLYNHTKATPKNAYSHISTKPTTYGIFATFCLALLKITCSITILTQKVIKVAKSSLSHFTKA